MQLTIASSSIRSALSVEAEVGFMSHITQSISPRRRRNKMRIARLERAEGSSAYRWLLLSVDNEHTVTFSLSDMGAMSIRQGKYDVEIIVGSGAIFTVDMVQVTDDKRNVLNEFLPISREAK
jgi:hypothetical protein